MNSRFSGRSGFGSWLGKAPSGSKKQRTASIGSSSSTGGSIAPAIPFAASITTRNGCTASTSMKEPRVMPEKVRRLARFSLASDRRRPTTS
jgi:hypothetical protein